MERTSPGEQLERGVLTVGFVAVVVAALAAHASPATGYEVSIYAGTPPLFWGAIAVALLAAVGVAYVRSSWASNVASAGLGVVAMTTVVSLPVLRGYHFYGLADPLTHLGWVRQMSEATLSPWEFIYPGTHTAAVGLGLLGGIPFRRSMQLVVVVFALAYMVFLPLLAWRLTENRRVALVAAFVALLLLPVNNTGFNLLFYPFSLTTFVAPLVLYLFFEHARGTTTLGTGAVRALFGTTEALLFLLVSTAIVLYHPQSASNLVLVLVAIAAAQFVGRRTGWLARGRPVYGMAGWIAVVFLLWSTRFGSFADLAALVALSALALVTRGEFGSIVEQRTGSAASLDVGGAELFTRLFLLDAVFLALSALLVVALVGGRLFGRDDERRTLTLYVATGMVVLVPYTALHLLGSLSGVNYVFRHLGFLVMLASVLGAIALVYIDEQISRRRFASVVTRASPVFAALALVVALVTVFSSPVVLLPSQQVTAQQMDGYQTTFQHDGGLEVVGIRGAPDRYADAYPHATADTGGDIDAAVIERNITTHYESDVLVAVSQTDEQREVVAYRELRYSSGTFEAIENRPGVSRVTDNGEFTLYHVDGDGE